VRAASEGALVARGSGASGRAGAVERVRRAQAPGSSGWWHCSAGAVQALRGTMWWHVREQAVLVTLAAGVGLEQTWRERELGSVAPGRVSETSGGRADASEQAL
jgi:hypothetical protein